MRKIQTHSTAALGSLAGCYMQSTNGSAPKQVHCICCTSIKVHEVLACGPSAQDTLHSALHSFLAGHG